MTNSRKLRPKLERRRARGPSLVLLPFSVGDLYVSRPVPKLGPFEIDHKSAA